MGRGGSRGQPANRPGKVGLQPEPVTATVLRSDPGSPGRLGEESRQALRRLSWISSRSGRLSPLAYYLTISHQHRFVWFRVAKAGTRTILGHLNEHAIPLDVARARIRYPTAAFDAYVKFAFVRHPVDRFLSAWQDKVVDANYFGFDDRTHAQMQSLDAFVEWTAGQDLTDLDQVDQHLALQTRLVDLSQVDHLGRLETFDRDFARVSEAIGLPVVPVTRRNQTGGRRPRRSGLPAGVQARVSEIYRRDFDVLGYLT